LQKKIIYIGNKLSSHGGTPTNIDTLGPQLEQLGFVLIYASSKLNMLARILDMMATIFRHRKEAGVILIDTYSTKAFYFAWICSRLSKKYKIPYIPILHGGNLPERVRNSPTLCREYLGEASTNIFISGYLRDALKDVVTQFTIIENNIDIGKYKFIERSKVGPRLLWVRSFHEIYNPGMAIAVLSMLRKVHPDANLLMIGPDKDGTMEQCRKLAHELNVLDSVIFTGKLTKEEWLRRSEAQEIFINTTNFDNLPVSVIEAQALGFPIVSTNVGGVPYLIEDQKNGLLVAPGDVEGMASAIEKYISDAKFTQSISINARKSAEQFDWQNISLKWKELLGRYV